MATPPRSPIRQLLVEKALVGTFLKLGQREAVEILARSGFDFAICDLEHSQITEQETRTVLLAGIACGLPIIVRVPSPDGGLMNRLLEGGAAGVQLPQLRCVAELEAFRAALRYPPQGSRSISLAQPAAGYGAEPLRDYIGRANEESLLVGQIETDRLDSPLEQLMHGLDVAFVGTLDLTVDMGVPGQTEHPSVQARLRQIEEAAKQSGVHLGIYADTVAAATRALAAGYRYVALSSDLGILQKASRALVQQVRDGAGKL
jgi:2-keto-3-deoxy-L-rhamnonate aldolase RhmA